jgi:hypothetical protein
MGIRSEKYEKINTYLGEYVSGAHLVESNATLYPFCFSLWGHTPDGHQISSRVAAFVHAGAYIAAERSVVDFANYEANKTYFPIRYREGRNPYKGVAFTTPRPWEKRTDRGGQHPDYVLLWSAPDERLCDNKTLILLGQIREAYDLIYVSPRTSLMQLYRRKNWNPLLASSGRAAGSAPE